MTTAFEVAESRLVTFIAIALFKLGHSIRKPTSFAGIRYTRLYRQGARLQFSFLFCQAFVILLELNIPWVLPPSASTSSVFSQALSSYQPQHRTWYAKWRLCAVPLLIKIKFTARCVTNVSRRIASSRTTATSVQLAKPYFITSVGHPTLNSLFVRMRCHGARNAIGHGRQRSPAVHEPKNFERSCWKYCCRRSSFSAMIPQLTPLLPGLRFIVSMSFSYSFVSTLTDELETGAYGAAW